MKVAVCGKGGSGKSTITTLLAKELAKRKRKVLVIDSDESNYGLSRQLGVELPMDFTAYFGGKQKALQDMMLSDFTHQFFNGTWMIQDIPEGYYSEKDGIKLMASGKIHTANEGCACTMGNVLTQFIEHLILAKDEYALIDMEAGIEHFGRGIDNSVDLILMVVEPSYESLALTEKVSELGQSIGKPVYLVFNKVDEENWEWMRENAYEGGQSLYVKCLRKKAFLLQDLREGNFQTVIQQLSGLPCFWKENNRRGKSIFPLPLLFRMAFSIFFWQRMKKCLKCCGKPALAVITNSFCNFCNTHLRFPQHFGSLFHTVFFDVGGNRGSVNGLESGF